MKKSMLGAAVAALSLTGCSSISDNAVYGPDGLIRDRSLDYQDAEQHAQLVLPPHLRAKDMSAQLAIPDIGKTATERQTGSFQVPRPEFFYADSGNERVSMVRDQENKRDKLIVVDEPIGDVWVKLQEFWAFNGVEVAKSDPRNGVMETAWVQQSGEEVALIDSWLRKLTFTDEGPVRDKLRIDVRPAQDDPQRTSIRLRHVQQPVDADIATINWDNQARDIGYKSDMMFEMLRYLSTASGGRDATSLVALRDKVTLSSQLGRDSRGNPVLRLDGSIDEGWNQVAQALDNADMDVGTRDQQKGIFYMTYTTSTPFDEAQSQGFFDWLHSDRGEIRLDTSFLDRAVKVHGGEVEDNGIRYSSLTTEEKLAQMNGEQAAKDSDGSLLPPEDNELAAREGFKIWFGGKVVYVFGAGNGSGQLNEATGNIEHTGQYQLKLNRTRQGVYLVVLTDTDLIAPAIVAEEILWDVKENLPSKR